MQPLAAGGKDTHAGTCRQHFADQRRGGQKLLQVVEHDQHLLAPQVGDHLQPCVVASQFQAKRQSQRCGDIGGALDGAQVNERGAVRVERRQTVRNLQGQPRLADARRTGQRQQASLMPDQAPADQIEVMPAPD